MVAAAATTDTIASRRTIGRRLSVVVVALVVVNMVGSPVGAGEVTRSTIGLGCRVGCRDGDSGHERSCDPEHGGAIRRPGLGAAGDLTVGDLDVSGVTAAGSVRCEVRARSGRPMRGVPMSRQVERVTSAALTTVLVAMVGASAARAGPTPVEPQFPPPPSAPPTVGDPGLAVELRWMLDGAGIVLALAAVALAVVLWRRSQSGAPRTRRETT
jgi:hypothetical protein